MSKETIFDETCTLKGMIPVVIHDGQKQTENYSIEIFSPSEQIKEIRKLSKRPSALEKAISSIWGFPGACTVKFPAKTCPQIKVFYQELDEEGNALGELEEVCVFEKATLKNLKFKTTGQAKAMTGSLQFSADRSKSIDTELLNYSEFKITCEIYFPQKEMFQEKEGE